MNSAELNDLTLRAKTAFAIMCFERYTAFVYSDVNFHPFTEMMRRMIGGGRGAGAGQNCRACRCLFPLLHEFPADHLYRYVYDFAFCGDIRHFSDGITDIFFPGAEEIGVQVFKKVPNATVHLRVSRMLRAYGPDYDCAVRAICQPAQVLFDLP